MIDPDELDQGHGWAMASLRIATDDLTCDEITERLEVRPSSTRIAEGEPSFAVWVLDSGLEATSSLEDHLYILVERLRDHGRELRELAEHATIEVWLSYSPGAAGGRTSVLDHRVLSEIGGVGADLVLDPYPVKARPERSPAGSS